MKVIRLFIKLFLLCSISFLSHGEPKAKSRNIPYIVSGLIEDFNRKHSEVINVVHLNVGKKLEMFEEVSKVLNRNNAAIRIHPKLCEKIENREGSFIIITSNLFNAVRTIT